MRSKWISLGLVAFTCTVVSLTADSCYPKPKCKPEPKPKCKPEPCCKHEPEPTCRPCCPPDPKYMQDAWGVKVDIDALYMKAGTPSSAIARQTLTHGGQTANGRVLELVSNMNWGFDMNLAYDFGRAQETEFAAEWFHIQSNWYQGPFTTATFITPTLGDADQYTSVGSLKASTHITLNFFDFTIGKRYSLFNRTNDVTVKPFFGLSGLTVRQKFKQVVNGIDVANPTANTSHTKIDGIGLVLGSRIDWNVGWGFSLVGAGKFSLLYDYLANKGMNRNIVDPSIVNSSSRFSLHMNSYLIDLKAGVQWKYVPCDCRYEVGLGAGWKLSYFEKAWNIGAGGHFTNNNLGYQGLYLNAFIGF
jgi:hypothetical protein